MSVVGGGYDWWHSVLNVDGRSDVVFVDLQPTVYIVFLGETLIPFPGCGGRLKDRGVGGVPLLLPGAWEMR